MDFLGKQAKEEWLKIPDKVETSDGWVTKQEFIKDSPEGAGMEEWDDFKAFVKIPNYEGNTLGLRGKEIKRKEIIINSGVSDKTAKKINNMVKEMTKNSKWRKFTIEENMTVIEIIGLWMGILSAVTVIAMLVIRYG